MNTSRNKMSRLIRAPMWLATLLVLMGMGRSSFGGELKVFNDNGCWCWYQDERAIISDGKLIIGSIADLSGVGGSHRNSDIEVVEYDIAKDSLPIRTLLKDDFGGQGDDHNTCAFETLPDGRILVMYAMHGQERFIYYRITTNPGDTTHWGPEQKITTHQNVTYSNIHRLSAENNGKGRIYDFYRPNPKSSPYFYYSDDHAQTWAAGGWFLNQDGHRPYLKYFSNGSDTIHFSATEGHPNDFNNSIYHGFVKGGKVYHSTGTLAGPLGSGIEVSSLTQVFQGSATAIAWTLDIGIDEKGLPYLVFSVNRNLKGITQQHKVDGTHKEGRALTHDDIRYHYARFDGTQWIVNEMAYAGTALYPNQAAYSGLVALDPHNPDVVYISSNSDPVTGAPLISKSDDKRHWEIFRGVTADYGKTWSWEAITYNSTADNLRPIIPEWKEEQRTVLLWLYGTMAHYGDFTLKVVGMFDPEPIDMSLAKVLTEYKPDVARLKQASKTPPIKKLNTSNISSNPFRSSETDVTSLRFSKLNAANPDDVVRLDVDGDGDVDILEAWWNGKRCRWFDEDDNMTLVDLRGDRVNDALQVDRDGDGYYDGPEDLNVDWVDNDGDGDSDLQVIITHPKAQAKMLGVAESNYMIFLDSDDDDVNAFIDWKTFDFPCWRTQGRSNFSPDYNGDSLFLKSHAPAFAVTDPRLSWENPFAFYDFDDDGCTEMTIRYVDAPVTIHPDGREEWKLSGKANEVFVSYDLDNDAQSGNELDQDMTLRFEGGACLPYADQVNPFPKLKAPEWVLPYYRYTQWRTIDELIFMPKELCHEKAFQAQWGRVDFIFDEDDDDHRWERVEMYAPHDPYVIHLDHNKKGPDGTPQKSMTWHPQCDQLGDRAEFDHDASGRGQLYVAEWDNKLHLYGAEKGTWLVDRNAEFFGSPNTPPATLKKRPTRVAEVVHYKDTNENGFLDLIEYDYDGNKSIDFSLSLLEFGSDEGRVISPGEVEWEGLHAVYGKLAKVSWKQAQELYEVIWQKGLNDPELDDLSIASSTAEKHRNAYWLKQTVLRTLYARYANNPSAQQELKRIFVTHDYKALAVLLER